MATWNSVQTRLTRLKGAEHQILRDGIRLLASTEIRKHPLALPEQPFDSILLRASSLFARSRKEFLSEGGRFYPTLVSSPRTLTSPSLLSKELEYTPIERELKWSATDPIESSPRRGLKKLLQTRAFCTSLYHEQNHRLLWDFLPPPTTERKALSRYLDTTEAFVVTLDMALGDDLGDGVARVFYLSGVTYDPGTDIRRDVRTKRQYRNYLHACLYTTYLKLQFYRESDIRKIVHHLYDTSDAGSSRLIERALDRALRLDDDFVQITNPGWQRRHLVQAGRVLSSRKRRGRGHSPLVFPEDPLKNHLHYLWAERWFDRFRL